MIRARTGNQAYADGMVYGAMVLAAAAAIFSTPRPDDLFQKVRWGLLTSTTSEMTTVARAIGDDSQADASP